MKIDLDYFKRILQVFLDATTAHIMLADIETEGITICNNRRINEKFLFHIQLLMDNQLIGAKDGLADRLIDIGIFHSFSGYSVVSKPIRLTQLGHDFASALNHNEVISKLKDEFKDMPFKTLFEGSQKLLQHYVKRKLDILLQE